MKQTIQTKDGETVTSADLFAVKEAIASWLETKDKYDSAIEVLERGSSKDVNKLLQFYDAAWDTSKLEGLLQ